MTVERCEVGLFVPVSLGGVAGYACGAVVVRVPQKALVTLVGCGVVHALGGGGPADVSAVVTERVTADVVLGVLSPSPVVSAGGRGATVSVVGLDSPLLVSGAANRVRKCRTPRFKAGSLGYVGDALT